MRRLILKRLMWALPMLFVVTFLSFVLVSLSPTDPASVVAGPMASAEEVEQVRVQLGLDKPMISRYVDWVGNVLHGDLGTSIASPGGERVTKILNSRIPATLSLLLLGLVLAATIGVSLGTFSAIKGGASGRWVSLLSLFGLAVPGFWLGLFLIKVFAVNLGWFPAIGFVGITSSPWQWFRSLVLPVISLAIGLVASLTKQTRAAFMDATSKDFVRNMQANGIPRRSVLLRHALKNAAIPIATLLGIQAVNLVGGAAITESIFAIPGLGSAAVDAAAKSDLPLVQGAILYFAIIVVVVGVIVDLSYAFLDPRVRVQ